MTKFTMFTFKCFAFIVMRIEQLVMPIAQVRISARKRHVHHCKFYPGWETPLYINHLQRFTYFGGKFNEQDLSYTYIHSSLEQQ